MLGHVQGIGVSGSGFGQSVSTSKDGSTVIVGAPDVNVDGKNHAGRAYVFKRTGAAWNQVALLTGPEPATRDFFGWASIVPADANQTDRAVRVAAGG